MGSNFSVHKGRLLIQDWILKLGSGQSLQSQIMICRKKYFEIEMKAFKMLTMY